MILERATLVQNGSRHVITNTLNLAVAPLMDLSVNPGAAASQWRDVVGRNHRAERKPGRCRVCTIERNDSRGNIQAYAPVMLFPDRNTHVTGDRPDELFELHYR